MSACPIHPGERGRHVGLLVPLEDPQGEVQVMHRCDKNGSHDWFEPARDPEALWDRAILVRQQLRLLRAALEADSEVPRGP